MRKRETLKPEPNTNETQACMHDEKWIANNVKKTNQSTQHSEVREKSSLISVETKIH